MPNTFVIKFEDEWVRMSEEQIPQVKNALEKVPWKRIQSRVINTNILLGISGELSLGLPHGITREEVERGNEILRDIYINMAVSRGEMAEDHIRFLRGEASEQEAHKIMGDLYYIKELEKIKQAEEEGKPYRRMWR